MFLKKLDKKKKKKGTYVLQVHNSQNLYTILPREVWVLVVALNAVKSVYAFVTFKITVLKL